MTTARLDLRLDEEVKMRAERAASLLGLKSLTEYIVKLMDENSKQVIAEHEAMTLKPDVFDRFVSACEQAEAPNDALTEALNYTRNIELTTDVNNETESHLSGSKPKNS